MDQKHDPRSANHDTINRSIIRELKKKKNYFNTSIGNLIDSIID